MYPDMCPYMPYLCPQVFQVSVPVHARKRPTHVAKETYSCGKRGLVMSQKRPTHVAKEAYSCGKRDLLMRQKRPTHLAKETYSCGKRGLLMRQKRPTLTSHRRHHQEAWHRRPQGGEGSTQPCGFCVRQRSIRRRRQSARRTRRDT